MKQFTMYAVLFILWIMLPAPAAGHGICQDGTPPVFDIEALCAGSEGSSQPPCNEETYHSYVKSGEKARRKRKALIEQTGAGCQLVEANFEGQTFRGAYFTRADLVEANLARAKIESFSFSDAILTRAQLQEATFIDGSFSDANLSKANLSKANLSRVILPLADLRGANLSGARFQDVIFYKANLRGAKLFGADLQGAGYLHDANLKGAVYDARTQFPEGFDPQAAGMRQEQ